MASEAKACPTCRSGPGEADLTLAGIQCDDRWHDAPPQPAPSRDAKITDEWCAIAGKEDVVRLDRIHAFAQKMITLGYMDGLKARTRIRKATEGVQPAPRGCDHKFVDSNHCLKCGWVPPPVPEPAQPAPAGFSKGLPTVEEFFSLIERIVAESRAAGKREALEECAGDREGASAHQTPCLRLRRG